MKKLFNILVVLIALVTVQNACFAFSASKVDKLILNSKLNETSLIAVSIKNLDTNEVVYEKNAKKLLHPASTLKIPTTYFSMNILGDDYLFRTGFYVDAENNLYIKLGADPFLTSGKLKDAILALKDKGLKSFNNLYIDDSIIDKKEFSTGWMWDDDVNPYTPKISAYNLDNNVVRVKMQDVGDGSVVSSMSTDYPMSVFSTVKTGARLDKVEVNRFNWNNPELVEISGEMTSLRPVVFPISSMRRYFIHALDKAFEDNGITFKSTQYASKLVPVNATLEQEITSSVKPAYSKILHNSNNLYSETLFKIAGANKYNSTGTEALALATMEDFYKKLHVNFKDVIVKDGSGVSRNNLVTAEWMTDVLAKIYKQKDFDKFKEYMPQTGDGTLSNRLHDLRGDAWLKTGSLANISAISGYVNSQDGKTYALTIFIQNFKEDQRKVKKFEDEIITLIYNR